MLLQIYALVVGLCVGSFLNVCISRWPLEQSVVRPRSRCPNCGHEIAWFENIPVVSWIALRARCRGCGQPISAVYPLVELSIGLVWFFSIRNFGADFTGLRMAVFFTILAGVAITDVKYYLIPDGFTISGLVFSVVSAFAAPFLGESFFFAGPLDSVMGACVGAGLIAIIGWLGEVVLGKEAMGMGDMTLMAFVGAALGPERALATVFLGATIGAVIFLVIVYPITLLRKRPAQPVEVAVEGSAAETTPGFPLVPFGVFLAPAAVITLLWGDLLIARVFPGL